VHQVDLLRNVGLPVAFIGSCHVYPVIIRSFLPAFQRWDRTLYLLTLIIPQASARPAARSVASDHDLFGTALAHGRNWALRLDHRQPDPGDSPRLCDRGRRPTLPSAA
jgi:hypothetical protein